jgi:hypothetical protein
MRGDMRRYSDVWKQRLLDERCDDADHEQLRSRRPGSMHDLEVGRVQTLNVGQLEDEREAHHADDRAEHPEQQAGGQFCVCQPRAWTLNPPSFMTPR